MIYMSIKKVVLLFGMLSTSLSIHTMRAADGTGVMVHSPSASGIEHLFREIAGKKPDANTLKQRFIALCALLVHSDKQKAWSFSAQSGLKKPTLFDPIYEIVTQRALDTDTIEALLAKIIELVCEDNKAELEEILETARLHKRSADEASASEYAAAATHSASIATCPGSPARGSAASEITGSPGRPLGDCKAKYLSPTRNREFCVRGMKGPVSPERPLISSPARKALTRALEEDAADEETADSTSEGAEADDARPQTPGLFRTHARSMTPGATSPTESEESTLPPTTPASALSGSLSSGDLSVFAASPESESPTPSADENDPLCMHRRVATRTPKNLRKPSTPSELRDDYGHIVPLEAMIKTIQHGECFLVHCNPGGDESISRLGVAFAAKIDGVTVSFNNGTPDKNISGTERQAVVVCFGCTASSDNPQLIYHAQIQGYEKFKSHPTTVTKITGVRVDLNPETNCIQIVFDDATKEGFLKIIGDHAEKKDALEALITRLKAVSFSK